LEQTLACKFDFLKNKVLDYCNALLLRGALTGAILAADDVVTVTELQELVTRLLGVALSNEPKMIDVRCP